MGFIIKVSVESQYFASIEEVDCLNCVQDFFAHAGSLEYIAIHVSSDW